MIIESPDGPAGLKVHSELFCGDHCAWHKPSDHHMKDWPKYVRVDRKDKLTERICSHGVGHPDPDEMQYLRDLKISLDDEGSDTSWIDVDGVHGCDGCCEGEK